jgi:hypothetical protein
MPQKIRIVARDPAGDAVKYTHFSTPIMAELAFYAFTHDPVASLEVVRANWYLEVQQFQAHPSGSLHNEAPAGEFSIIWVCVNWHCPYKSKYEPYTDHVDGFNSMTQPR